MTTSTSTTLAQRATALLVLTALQLQLVSPAIAGLAQKPLLYNEANAVLPNFVLTLDNSGSMRFKHMPETTTTVNGKTVNMGGSRQLSMHPDDTFYAGNNVAGTPTGLCAKVDECQLRSPDVNTIYYNPSIRYLAWRNPSIPTTRMPDAQFKKAYLDPNNQSGANAAAVDLSAIKQGINAGIFYLLSKTGDPNVTSSYTKFDLNTHPSNTMAWGRSDYPERTDCTAQACTLAQEQANFANWFTYYRARLLMAKGAVSEAFASQGTNFRLGWGNTALAFQTNVVDGVGTAGGPTQGVRDFTASHKQAFLTWLQTKEANSSTPLRKATHGVGSYFKRTDNGSPWRSTPGVSGTTSPLLGCRRGAHILTTDGYYNDDSMGPRPYYQDLPYAVGEVDNLPQGPATAPTYVPVAPYMDSVNSNSLADIAMYFWANPLVPSSFFSNPNDQLTPTANDPATWLHLKQYMVGIGVAGTVNPDTVSTTMTSATSWPRIVPGNTGADPTKIDDMLHASVNSRGRYFGVTDAASLQAAIANAIKEGTAQVKQPSGVATNGLTAVAGDQAYTVEYNTGDWYGDVKAFAVGTAGTITSPTPVWSAAALLTPLPASTRDARNIVTYNSNATGGGSGIPFKWANLTGSSSLQAIAPAYQTPGFIDYIRGDDSLTGTVDGTFRIRKGPLGDFVNTTPTLVRANVDLGYTQLPSGGSTYAAFLASKATRAPILFAGANDGMLHAFNATTTTGGSGGTEVFAYVPKGALPSLHLLATQTYDHQFYVDGPLTETDAFIATPNSTTPGWSNVLIGTMGAGGKSVFAIDVTGTARSGGSATMDPGNVMWEISGDDLPALGHVTSRVQVGAVQNGGGWYAFVGNGHESDSGTAALLVVNLSTGAVVKTFTLPSVTAASNGLSGVSLMRNAQGEVTGAYAGDLHGQVWRFEFSGSDPALWKVGFNGTPLFTAKDGAGAMQMISAAPSHFAMPASSGVSGNLVVFGTGRLVDTADATDRSVQTIYAVLDDTVGGTSANSPAGASGGRALLQAQSFLPQVAGNSLIQLSSNAVLYTGTSKKYGWFLDLDLSLAQVPGATGTSNPRPKVIYQPQVIRNLVYLATAALPDEAVSCNSTRGSGYSFLLPVMNGGQLSVPTYDTNGDGLVNASDTLGQVNKDGSPDGDDLIRNTGDSKLKTEVDTHGPRVFDSCAAGGVGCEPPEVKVNTISDRVWKRIVKPPF